jgi:hypothetical protein
MSGRTLGFGLLGLIVSGLAHAGMNPNITLPLHFMETPFATCTDYLPVDCQGDWPEVSAVAGSTGAVFLFAYNYTSLAGVQTAFDFGGWTLMFGLWDCQVGQLSAVTPANPGGPTAGSITTAFTPVTSGELLPIGRMFFQVGLDGCLSQVQSSYPFGIHVIDALLQNDAIVDLRRGRTGTICVGYGGYSGCEPLPAVEPATWGGIKAQYR